MPLSVAGRSRLARFADSLRPGERPRERAVGAEAGDEQTVATADGDDTAVGLDGEVDIAKAARARRLRNVWVTCGYIQQEPLVKLRQYLDAANVDLKSFSQETYRKLNSGKLAPVLQTLKTMKRMNVWIEVSYLVVPTYADNDDDIKRMSAWVLTNLGADHPLHFLRFHPAHRLIGLPPTPIETMQRCRQIAQEAGMKHVYLGNVRQVPDADTTFCPSCHKPVVEREGWMIRANNVANGRCKYCQTKIAGVWST